MSEIFDQLKTYVICGDLEKTIHNVQLAINWGETAEDVLKKSLIAAMTEVGRLFEEGEYFVPEMLVSARAMKGGLELLKPLLMQEDVKPIGTVVIGTVQGDLHDIGKSLVAMMYEGIGFKVVDLGTDVQPQTFVDSVREYCADIIAMSALLTTTMPKMEETIEMLQSEGVHEDVKVMVGGAPINEGYASKIGADGYSKDASGAARIAISLIS